MRAPYAILGATCVSALLMFSGIVSAGAESEESTDASVQQDEILTATAFSAIREDAWDSAKSKAWNLCMVRGLYNIKRLSADCTSADLRWDCVGTAACRK
jgi:hypothetical protein